MVDGLDWMGRKSLGGALLREKCMFQQSKMKKRKRRQREKCLFRQANADWLAQPPALQAIIGSSILLSTSPETFGFSIGLAHNGSRLLSLQLELSFRLNFVDLAITRSHLHCLQLFGIGKEVGHQVAPLLIFAKFATRWSHKLFLIGFINCFWAGILISQSHIHKV